MKPGTPRFVGARVREAREARGLTATALAELVGVTRSAISQYENDLGSPRPEVMQKLSEQLNLPIQFFLRPVRPHATSNIFYRSMSAATKAARTRGERRFNWVHADFLPYLRAFVDLPPVNYPLASDLDPLALGREDMDDVAIRARRYWGLGEGPISNVVWLLENNGTIISRGFLDAETLDSFSAWMDGVPSMFLGADKGSAARSRFDAAHELGHLLLHSDMEQKAISSAAVHRRLEDQADYFAGSFLLPAESFARDVYAPTLEALRALKQKWMASIGLMIMRLENLEIISQERARKLLIARAKRGWNRWEPLDDELPVEEPRLQRAAFELLLGEGVQARGDILAALPYATPDIEELAALPPGLLADKPAQVSLLTFPTRPIGPESDRSDASGELLPFTKQRHSS